jgi:hypothetical protein
VGESKTRVRVRVRFYPKLACNLEGEKGDGGVFNSIGAI